MILEPIKDTIVETISNNVKIADVINAKISSAEGEVCCTSMQSLYSGRAVIVVPRRLFSFSHLCSFALHIVRHYSKGDNHMLLLDVSKAL